MIRQALEFTLKDGRKAVIRSANDSDEAEAKAALDFITKSCGETDFLLRYSEEWADTTIESEQGFLAEENKSDTKAMLFCFVDGKIAGNCDISWGKNLKTRHRASVGIALLREYWNLGIGTRFFQELINIAKENEYLEQIELEFVEGNSRARALYEKMGFRITGLIPDGVKLKDGRLQNIYTMMRKL